MKESTIQGLDERDEEETKGLRLGKGLGVVNIGSYRPIDA